jgi:hypothetical protein
MMMHAPPLPETKGIVSAKNITPTSPSGSNASDCAVLAPHAQPAPTRTGEDCASTAHDKSRQKRHVALI